MKSSLERKLAAAIAVALVTILGFGVLQYYTARRLTEDSQWVSHSREVLGELADSRSKLNRADASAQSFLITGDSSYGATYSQAITSFREDLQSLRKLSADNAVQQHRLDSLDPLVAISLRAYQEEIDSRKAGVRGEGPALALERAVRNSTDALRSAITSMEADELDLLRQRSEAARQANGRVNLFILLGSLLAGVLLAAFAVALRLDIAARSRSETKFRNLLEAAPDAVVIVDKDGRIALVNTQTETQFGYGRNELLGQPVEMLMPERYRAIHRGHRGGFLQAPRVRAMGANLELLGLRKDGTEFPIEISLSPMETSGENLVSSAIRDVTARKSAEATVKSQAEFLNAANDAIWAAGRDETITYWNQGAQRLYGWTAKDAIGKSPHELLHTKFPVPFEEIARQRQDGGWQGELVHTRRDGTKVTVASSWTTLKDAEGNLTGWLEINTDISERKRAEESLRAVSGRLLQMQEDERRHIGRELHDGLGQYLSVLKMGLDSLRTAVGLAGDGAGEKLAECVHLAEQSLTEVRTASYLLYPPMLDELGLQSAIPMYLEGFAKRAGVRTTFEVPPDFGRAPRDIELALFRVLQESLTNVHRHSGSTTVHVQIAVQDGVISLAIRDAGKGIPRDKLDIFQKGLPGTLGVGLRGMNERMRQFGGKLEVSSTSQGTTVRVTIPSAESILSAAAPAQRAFSI